MVNIQASNVNINRGLLEEYQIISGFKLPEDYLNFLIKYNGGVPESNIVKLKDCDIESFSITSFFGVGLEINDDLLFQSQILKNRIPNGCIPIARVEGGNIICMSLNDEKNRQIILWNHEKELENQDNITLEELSLVADSFTSFINKIMAYNPEDEDLSGYMVEEIWVDPDLLK